MSWEMVKLGDVFPVIRNGASIKQGDNLGGIPITRIETIASGFIDNSRLGFADVSTEKYSDYYLNNGDILMSHINSWLHLGKTALVQNLDSRIIHGMNLLLLRVESTLLQPKFAKYYFETLLFKTHLNKISNQSVNQSSFAISKLKKIQIPLPPLSTQKRIAEILDKADALRKADRQLLKHYDNLAQSLFIELFGDPVKNEKGWEVKKLGEVVENIVGGTSYGGEQKALKEDELGVLKISAITSGSFIDDEYKAVKKINIHAKIITPKKGDLLFSRANTRELVGATCIVLRDYPNLFLPDKLWRIDLDKENCNSHYLKFLLSDKHFKINLTKTATGTSGSMLNISMQKLKLLDVPIPPIALQDRFAEQIQNIEQQKEKVKAQLLASEHLFQALLKQAFSGGLN